MGTIQFVIAGLFVVSLLAFLVTTRWRGSKGSQRRRFGGGLAAPGVPVLGVREGVEIVRRLIHKQAQWPEISEGLNPTRDSQIAAVILVLRGPHMFVPMVALNLVQVECERLVKVKPFASMGEALQAAVRSMERITRFGD